MFQWKEQQGVMFLTIPTFTETGLVKHGFTSRIGGVSEAPYDSLNMGLTVADQPSRVIANRSRMAQLLNFPVKNLVAAKQIHGDRVAVITTSHRGRGALDYGSAIADTDALITAEPGVPISTYHADCVPILVLDPVTPAIGLAHAGWKGTALKIAGKTIEKMVLSFGTKAKDCLVAIGPSIGPCCYAVDGPVRNAFRRQFSDSRSFFRETGREHWLLNLWVANQRVLEESGVPSHQIFVSGHCTACCSDRFFSYRKQGGSTGRMAALMMLQG